MQRPKNVDKGKLWKVRSDSRSSSNMSGEQRSRKGKQRIVLNTEVSYISENKDIV